jgi:hypothetical protein
MSIEQRIKVLKPFWSKEMLNLKIFVCSVGLFTLGTVASASASPYLYLTFEGSATGQAGSYTPSFSAAPGTSFDFEIVVQSALPPVSNTNSPSHAPNGTGDTISSLPVFSFSDSLGGSYDSATLSTQFADGGATGVGVGSGTGGTGVSISSANGGSNNLLSVRAISSSYAGDDSPQVVVSGSFTVGSSESTVNPTGVYVGGSNGSGGFFKVGGYGVPLQATDSTEESSAPFIAYIPVPTPEPASLGLLALGGLAMLRRQRRTTATI